MGPGQALRCQTSRYKYESFAFVLASTYDVGASAAGSTIGYEPDWNQAWRTLERTPTNPAANRVRDGHESTTVVTSEALLGTQRQISIIHNGERYTLRITANNKLILTK